MTLKGKTRNRTDKQTGPESRVPGLESSNARPNAPCSKLTTAPLIDRSEDEKRREIGRLVFIGEPVKIAKIMKQSPENVRYIADLLKNGDAVVKRITAQALKNAAGTGNQETRHAITIEINKIIQSKLLGQESANYSALFVDIVTHCAKIMGAARKAEEMTGVKP